MLVNCLNSGPIVLLPTGIALLQGTSFALCRWPEKSNSTEFDSIRLSNRFESIRVDYSKTVASIGYVYGLRKSVMM